MLFELLHAKHGESFRNFIKHSILDHFFLHNAFSFYKKNILIKYPFDKNLSTKEDRYWINDRIKEGLNSYYDSVSECYHHYTNNGATWRGLG